MPPTKYSHRWFQQTNNIQQLEAQIKPVYSKEANNEASAF